MIPRYQGYRERIVSELDQIRRAAGKAEEAFNAAEQGGSKQPFFLDSAALNLHAFYNGVERLLEMLARELDGTVPTGPSWQRELLEQMSLSIPDVRPVVIRAETRAALEEYSRFRHIVRNIYVWEFDPSKIGDLVHGLPSVLRDLEADLEQFRQFLDAAGHADETG